MLPTVDHPRLKRSAVEARAYQLEGVAEALECSTLLVYPTAAGKTAVSAMVVAEVISDGGRAVMLAPTVGLVEQHKSTLTNWLTGEVSVSTLTGSTAAEKRKPLWNSSMVIIATPQVFHNDVLSGLIDPSTIEILIVDEAHHSVGSHAMGKSCDEFIIRGGKKILAMTASPGYSKSHVEALCRRLGIDRIHTRSSTDSGLKRYLSDLELIEVRVEVPEELVELASPLKQWQEGLIDTERRLGRYVHEGKVTYSGLSSAMERARGAISRGDGTAFASVSRLALALTLNHLINHILSQGVGAAREFLRRKSSESSASKKSTRAFLSDNRVTDLRNKLDALDEVHTKIGTVRRLVSERLRRSPESKIIIFANFRDTVASIHRAIEGIEGAIPLRFVGQSKRPEGGLTSKEQIQTISEFKQGLGNILVATSVGEEGLDIPSADLVIFYEPVGSETRTIQRRGRTGRRRQGDVVVLIAEGTRDEAAAIASHRREMAMMKSIHAVRRALKGGPINYSLLGSFSIEDIGGEIDAGRFIKNEREANKYEFPKAEEAGSSMAISAIEEEKRAKPAAYRPSGQSGLDEF